ncbi:hypothetical protein Tco_0689870 [Tanacetum coccineum]
MNPIATQQAALDDALVPPKKRLKIERCNARIAFSKPQRQEKYRVILEALKLSPCYPAFLITAEVPEIYMHQFGTPSQRSEIQMHTVLKFVALPSEEELLSFIKELGYFGKCNMLSTIYTDQMHQPWRTFAAIINRCISGKTTGLDRLRESRAQILWGMYNQKNIDYVALLWEDFMYQADNREISSARKEHMPYLRFTRVIIDHFISKDKTIFMRNIINLHTVRDDSLLGTLKFVSKTDDTQKYGALIPDEMINQNIKDSKAYKTYYDFATGKVEPKKSRKFKKVASPSIKLDTPGVSVSKKKSPSKADRGKVIELLSDAGANFESEVPDESKAKPFDTNSKDESDDINDDDNANDDDNKNEDDDGNDAHDSERTNSNDDDENPSFTLKDYDEEEHDEEYESDDD